MRKNLKKGTALKKNDRIAEVQIVMKVGVNSKDILERIKKIVMQRKKN